MRTALSPKYVGELTLPRFEAWVCLIDDIDPAFAAHDAAIFVALLQRLNGIGDFHNTQPRLIIGRPQTSVRAAACQPASAGHDKPQPLNHQPVFFTATRDHFLES